MSDHAVLEQPTVRVPVLPLPRRDLVGLAFGEVVAELYSVPASKIGEALDQQVQKGGRLGEILVSMKVISDAQVAEALAAQLDLPYLEQIESEDIPDDVLRQVPIAFARANGFVPLGRGDDQVILLATTDPLDTPTHDALRALLHAEIELAVAAPETIIAAINNAYDRATRQAESAVEALEGEDGNDIGDVDDEVVDLLYVEGDDEAPIIRLVN
jgi:general secretion pathway protein E